MLATNADGLSTRGYAQLIVQNTPPVITRTGAATASVGTPYSITFAANDPGDDRVFEWQVNWGDGTVQRFGAGTTGATYSYQRPGAFNIVVGAVDEDSPRDANGNPIPYLAAPLAVTVRAETFAANAGGPYTVLEGGSLQLNGSAPGAPVQFLWDMDGNGSLGEVTGASPILTWAQLQGFGINDNGLRTIGFAAGYPDGSRSLGFANLTVVNAAPSASATQDGPAREGETVRLRLAISDPSLVDTAAGFTLELDVDGDGQIDVSRSGWSGGTTFLPLDASFFPDDGAYTVSGFVTDKDGGPTAFTTRVTIDNTPPDLVLGGPPTVLEGSAYRLDLGASDPGDDAITSWLIEWGDGNAVTLDGAARSATHVFANEAARTIRVTAVDEDGAYVATRGVTVLNAPPVLGTPGFAPITEGEEIVLAGLLGDP
ncbi:MAG: PKD domain-containing protein, partial [Vicinamibacterales bacterium]|nr:PKD domain-containing protein [Vicinamibacterales bacterium]